MKDDRLSSVGKKIKELRKGQGQSLQELASKSGVTAGLLSKIENFRTIPSLPVLLNIARALDVNMSELVRSVIRDEVPPYEVLRRGKGETETAPGLVFERLLSRELPQASLLSQRITLTASGILEEAEAHTFLHILQGQVQLTIDADTLPLHAGDTCWIDAGHPYRLVRAGPQEAQLLLLYALHK
ncbi:MAG: XRE family transcriptional regulator [Bacteroidia bacterium]